MRYLIIERFLKGDPAPVYARFRGRGRLAPEGLGYIDSWVSADLAVCFQIMECEDPALIDQWIEQWSDLIDFEVIPVISSAEAAAKTSAESERGVEDPSYQEPPIE